MSCVRSLLSSHSLPYLTFHSGYSVYSTIIGAETPCFSSPTLSYIPASSTSSGVTLITDIVFSKRYILVKPAKKQLATGAIAGIAVNAFLFAAAPFVILFFIRRHRKAKLARANGANAADTQLPRGDTFPPVEPDFANTPPMAEFANNTASPTATTHELSPDSARTPATMKGMPFQSLTSNPPVPKEAFTYEMPGSTHIHEHHPMYTGSQTDVSGRTLMNTPPHTPPRSPAVTATSATRSPVLSPSNSYGMESPSAGVVVTPLGSPRPASTRFREGTM